MKLRCAPLVIALTILFASGSEAAGPDDQFIRIYDLIEQADGLQQNGQPRGAYQQYLEALAKLKKLQAAYPAWNKETVQFRQIGRAHV